MDLVAVGYPSPLATWAFRFLEAALRRIASDLAVLRLDRFDTVADLGAHQGTRLILSMFPSPDFAEACRANHVRSLIFADDLVEAVQHVRAAHAKSIHEALRPVSCGLVLAGPFARSPLGRVVGRELDGTMPDILRLLLAHLGLALSDEAARTLCRDIGAEEESLNAALRQPSTAPSKMSEADSAVVFQVLGGLRKHLEHADPGDVTWPHYCFLMGDEPNSSPPLALAVTGRARIIYYGPYLHLPRGLWTVRVSIGFSQDVRGMPFSIEVHSNELLGKARILAERGGIFSLEFEIAVTAPHEPIEVRIMNEQGAIEGHMGLVGVDFLRWRAHPDDMSSAA